MAFPALALLGGAALFIHTHDGGFHLDQRFLHHAIMGATALAGGVALLVAHGTRAGRAVLTVAWPILLTVVANLAAGLLRDVTRRRRGPDADGQVLATVVVALDPDSA